jgi:hypothetical protein
MESGGQPETVAVTQEQQWMHDLGLGHLVGVVVDFVNPSNGELIPGRKGEELFTLDPTGAAIRVMEGVDKMGPGHEKYHSTLDAVKRLSARYFADPSVMTPPEQSSQQQAG